MTWKTNCLCTTRLLLPSRSICWWKGPAKTRINTQYPSSDQLKVISILEENSAWYLPESPPEVKQKQVPISPRLIRFFYTVLVHRVLANILRAEQNLFSWMNLQRGAEKEILLKILQGCSMQQSHALVKRQPKKPTTLSVICTHKTRNIIRRFGRKVPMQKLNLCSSYTLHTGKFSKNMLVSRIAI